MESISADFRVLQSSFPVPTIHVYKCLSGLAPAYLADDCVLVSSVASRRHLRSAEARKLACRPENKNSTRRQRLRRLQRSRLELSAGRTRSFIADCCTVCEALENSLVLVPELAHRRIFILRYTNVLVIIIMVALCNRADHYIFILFLSFFFFFLVLFFPRLISAVGNWMFTILWHMVWP